MGRYFLAVREHVLAGGGGTEGPPGPQGEPGEPGPPGPEGPQGTRPDRCDRQPLAPQGRPVATGPQGPRATAGATGATGATGASRYPGTAGYSGTRRGPELPRLSTFTVTATGFSTAPSGTARYVRVGTQVTLRLPRCTGTSQCHDVHPDRLARRASYPGIRCALLSPTRSMCWCVRTTWSSDGVSWPARRSMCIHHAQGTVGRPAARRRFGITADLSAGLREGAPWPTSA